MSTELTDQIGKAIGAHGAWKLRLNTAIRIGKSDITSKAAARDCDCPFGQWLHGSGIDRATKAGLPYQVVRRLHAEFHRSAGDVLACVENGDKQKALALIETDFTPRSEKLSRALYKWKGEASRLVCQE